MAKPKIHVSMISGPINAKHVGGVNIIGGSPGSSLDHYFSKIVIEPDEVPSHTFVAAGRVEAPRRSDTITSTLRRPSISLQRSFSHLRGRSLPNQNKNSSVDDRTTSQNESISRSDSMRTTRPIRMRPSIVRLRQKVGLDRDLYEYAPKLNAPYQQPEIIPAPVQKGHPPLHGQTSLARPTMVSSIYTPTTDYEPSILSIDSPQPHSGPAITQRRPVPTHQRSIPTKSLVPILPVRPRRADSGTSTDVDTILLQEQPLPFKKIVIVQKFSDRMAMYKETREYWAHADHGLVEWTGRAGGPKSTTCGCSASIYS